MSKFLKTVGDKHTLVNKNIKVNDNLLVVDFYIFITIDLWSRQDYTFILSYIPAS